MPSSAAKLVTVFGLTGNVEPSYGAGVALSTATDGILLAAEALGAISYAHSGAHGPAAGAGGIWLSAAASGRTVKLPVKIEARGAAAAYSATTTFAQDLHTLLQISGHSASYSSGTWTYAPIVSGFKSGAFNAYARGELYSITGALAEFGFEVGGAGFLDCTFDIDGLLAAMTDVTLPAITYGTNQPAKAESLTCSIGTWTTPVIRKLTFKKGNVISPRLDINAAGHGGFGMGRHHSTLAVVAENPALSTFDVYGAAAAGTSCAVTFTHGATAGNKFTFAAPQAQIDPASVKEGADGAIGTIEFTLNLTQSTPIAADDYTLKAL